MTNHRTRAARNVLIIAVILGSLLFAAEARTAPSITVKQPAHKQAWQYRWQKWLPPVWQRLAKCETGLNWKHNSGTYQGAFGFYHGSWDAFRLPGYPSEAYNATPWQQWRVALAIHRRYGFSGWGCYQGAAHAWVRGE